MNFRDSCRAEVCKCANHKTQDLQSREHGNVQGRTSAPSLQDTALLLDQEGICQAEWQCQRVLPWLAVGATG